VCPVVVVRPTRHRQEPLVREITSRATNAGVEVFTITTCESTAHTDVPIPCCAGLSATTTGAHGLDGAAALRRGNGPALFVDGRRGSGNSEISCIRRSETTLPQIDPDPGAGGSPATQRRRRLPGAHTALRLEDTPGRFDGIRIRLRDFLCRSALGTDQWVLLTYRPERHRSALALRHDPRHRTRKPLG